MSVLTPGILYRTPYFQTATTLKTDNGFGNPEHPLDNLGDLSPATYYESEGEPFAGSTRKTILEIRTTSEYRYNAIAIANHNLGNVFVGGSMTAKWGDAGNVYFSHNFGSALQLTPYYRRVVSGSNGNLGPGVDGAKLTLEFTHNAPLRIGAIYVGETLELPRGPYAVGSELPEFDDGIDGSTNVSQTGLVVGRSIYRRPVPFKITQSFVSGDFARGQWREFLRFAQYFPWVFSNDVYDFPLVNDRQAKGAVFCQATIPITRPRAYSADRFTCNLDAVALPIQYERFPNDYELF